MQVEFDPAKDAANQTKHSVSLSMAGELEGEAAILYDVAFVDEGGVRRIISLRRANRREVEHHVENLQACRCAHAYQRRRHGHHRGGPK